jgi:hypothetical protein
MNTYPDQPLKIETPSKRIDIDGRTFCLREMTHAQLAATGTLHVAMLDAIEAYAATITPRVEDSGDVVVATDGEQNAALDAMRKTGTAFFSHLLAKDEDGVPTDEAWIQEHVLKHRSRPQPIADMHVDLQCAGGFGRVLFQIAS